MNLPVPEALNVISGNRSKNFDVFKQKWMNYAIATGLDTKTEKQKLATLLTIIGSEAIEVYNTFEWINEAEMICENVLDRFEKFCKPKRNITYERYVLLTRKQGYNEQVADYVKDLRTLAESCEYGTLKESIIKDAFVLGVNDNRLRENFLKDCNLNLENAIEIARATEKAKEQSLKINGDNDETIMKIDRKKTSGKVETIKDCNFCGREHRMKKEYCPAYGKKCKKCDRFNHFSSKCKTREMKMIEKTSDDEEEFAEYYIQ